MIGSTSTEIFNLTKDLIIQAAHEIKTLHVRIAELELKAVERDREITRYQAALQLGPRKAPCPPPAPDCPSAEATAAKARLLASPDGPPGVPGITAPRVDSERRP
jgi:hypothetical protein